MEKQAQTPLNRDLKSNREKIEEALGRAADLTVREFRVGPVGRQLTGLVAYLEGVTSIDRIERLLENLMIDSARVEMTGSLRLQSLDGLAAGLVSVGSYRLVKTIDEVALGVAKADLAILLAGQEQAILADLCDPPARAITEPTFEPIGRGPKEGFTELLKTNLALLRRRLPHPSLRLESVAVGRYSRTEVVVAWLEGVADPAVVREVLARVKGVKIDGVVGSAYIEEFIEDSPFSPFPQIKYTERPERVQSDLFEGRVAIFVDGTPMALVAPTTFWSALEAADDNFERPQTITFIRWIRFFALGITLLGPAVFVALTTIHHEMIPTSLALVIAAGREPIPFPAIVEALIMEVVFEILREAGLRLPRVIGGAVSIVGPLVLGEAAVQAGLINPFMVIVVSLTAMASSTIPNISMGTAIRLIRFPMLILAGTLGLFGVMWGVIALNLHLVTLRSFGAPFLEPISPFKPGDLKEVLVRLPRWMLTGRKRVPYTVAPGQLDKGGGPNAV